MPPRKKPANVTFDDATASDSDTESTHPRYTTTIDDPYSTAGASGPRKRRAYNRRKPKLTRDDVDDLIDGTNKLAKRTKNKISGTVKRYLPERYYYEQDDMYTFAYYVGLGTCILVTAYAVFKLIGTNSTNK